MIDIDDRLHEFGLTLRDGDPAPQPELTRRSHKLRRRRWMRRGLSAGVIALVAVVIVATLQDGPTRERVRTTPATTGSASTVLGVDAGYDRLELHDLDSGTSRPVTLPGKQPGDYLYDVVATAG